MRYIITEFLKQGGIVVKLSDGWAFKNCNGLTFHARMHSSDLRYLTKSGLKKI